MTDVRSGDEKVQIGCRVLYESQTSKIYLIWLWPSSGREVEVRISNDALLVDHKPAGTVTAAGLQSALSLPSTEQGRLLAEDLAREIARIGALPFDLAGDTTRMRRWEGAATHDANLWYEGTCGLKLYPPQVPVPK